MQQLIKAHGSRNPFVIANALGIRVVHRSYSVDTKGYYLNAQGRQFIVINSNLPSDEQIVIAAHELGHACLHFDLDISFIQEHTLFPVGRYEREANIFASELLISAQMLERYPDYNVEQIASIECVYPDLVRLKLMGLSRLSDRGK